MTKVILPKTNEIGANEWADVYSNDSTIAGVVNGELDNENLAASAGIVDTKLASPNNNVYTPILSAQQMFRIEGVTLPAAGTYILAGTDTPLKSAQVGSGATVAIGPPYIYFDDADYAVAGKTTKLRLRAQVACNEVAPAITFTFGLYPFTTKGTVSTIAATVGTVVSGSTAAIAAPSGSTPTSAVTADFTIPSDGAYLLAVVTSATLATNSAAFLSAQLQIRHV